MAELMWDFLAGAHRNYFPDETFPDAIVLAAMLVAVFLADQRDKTPLTRNTLATRMQMSAETTRRRVTELIASGAIVREGHALRVTTSTLATPRGVANAKNIEQRIIATAAALTKMGGHPPKMGA